MTLDVLDSSEQLGLWHDHVNDPRAAVPSGFEGLDSLLEGNGFGYGELVILGGVTGTRKTTVMLNMIVNMLRADYSVGVIGLDEPESRYIGKLLSTIVGESVSAIKDQWDGELGERCRKEYRSLCDGRLVTAKGAEPSIDALNKFLDESAVLKSVEPSVLFIDYLTLLFQDKYDGAEVNRIPKLVRGLQTWTHDRGIVTIVLHQVGRLDEGTGGRYHGHTPMTVRALKYGGEEFADIVLGTYRPSKCPIGTQPYEVAREAHPKMQYEDWQRKRDRVEMYKEHTLLQLIKNRPGVHVDEEGVPMRSIGESMQMQATPQFARPWEVSEQHTSEDSVRAYGGDDE